jgi:predicted trehalose synthase
MSNADLKGALALADLIRDLALAEDRRKKRFAAIVRFVRRREARGSAKDIMAQIRGDHRLGQLLVDYETESEIIGMMEFVRHLKMKSPPI